MEQLVSSVITGSGSYIPDRVIDNDFFLRSTFYDKFGERILKPIQDVIATLQKITDINQRRYVADNQVTSDMGYLAAVKAIDAAGIDAETLDYIIVAHNFGDLKKDNVRVDLCPTLAARIKHKLKIANPYTVAYDLPFGCPGWIQGVIQADYYIRSGDAKKILVIGAETLSRISDPYDIDSMIFSDGAGAVILEAIESQEQCGLIKHLTRSDTLDEAHFLEMKASNFTDFPDNTLFLKMNGRKLYEYAIKTVSHTLKACLEKAGVTLSQIKKILIHQANAKMDYNIMERLFNLCEESPIPTSIMPMSIDFLGNNSVATIPILYDLVAKGKLEGHQFCAGDYLLFASVGAGMNINAFVYRCPPHTV